MVLGLMLVVEPAAGQARARLRIGVAPAAERWAPVVEVDGLLQDAALRDALDSGLPLRIRLRVELWADRFFDRLEATEEVAVALTQDPLDRAYVLASPAGERHLATVNQAGAAIMGLLQVPLRPTRVGRYYYLATLEIETLSLSDLEELRRWLRGEVGPAVEGRGSPEGAVESGLRRVLVRVIGLPTRRMEARSGSFTAQ